MKLLKATPDNILLTLQAIFSTPAARSSTRVGWADISAAVRAAVAIPDGGWMAVRYELQVLLDAEQIHRATGMGEEYLLGAKPTEVLTLHSEAVTLGVSEVLTIGTNMACRSCITKVKLVRSTVDGLLLVVSGGCRMYVDTLTNFYLNTPANRKLLTARVKLANA